MNVNGLNVASSPFLIRLRIFYHYFLPHSIHRDEDTFITVFFGIVFIFVYLTTDLFDELQNIRCNSDQFSPTGIHFRVDWYFGFRQYQTTCGLLWVLLYHEAMSCLLANPSEAYIRILDLETIFCSTVISRHASFATFDQ